MDDAATAHVDAVVRQRRETILAAMLKAGDQAVSVRSLSAAGSRSTVHRDLRDMAWNARP